MTVIVKDRLLNLLQGQLNSYYEWVGFFLDPNICDYEKEKHAAHFLNKELEQIDLSLVAFPVEISQIPAWCQAENQTTGVKYQAYLERRRGGAKREYFPHIGQAFEFLVKIAPVKKVDGAWLYSLLQYWNAPTFHDLILIYLEELGLGQTSANHVCMYDDLLRVLGLDDFEDLLEDQYYHHPAIQLALAYAPAELIPEIIGFNLGYEQLPLHLLITNYELAELGIDSKYFNQHITIDNLDSGHAYKSIQAVECFSEKYPDQAQFLHRLKRGYVLNYRGVSSTQIIQNLDLQQWVYKIFKRKARVGQLIHNDKCKFADRSVNQWLSQPEKVEQFLEHLVEHRWIQLNADPEQSRFWQLIHHVDGKMYGVFSLAEQQMIHDWIAGDNGGSSYLACKKIMHQDQHIQAHLFDYFADDELETLQNKIAQAHTVAHKICKLIPFLAPGLHHKNIGLWSTQKFVECLFPYVIHHPISNQPIHLTPQNIHSP